MDNREDCMKKFVLIPDSFKGTMSSSRICEIMEENIRPYYPDAEIVKIPVADGGEGSVDAFLTAVGGKKVTVPVKGPYFEDVKGFYGILEDGTAVVEMAACAGLPMVGDNKQPDKTTTYGVGQLIAHAAKSGCRKIVVGLGGSATNDCGAGAAAAIGIKFLDENGESFVPSGGTLSRVKKIDCSGKLPELADVEIVTMCDIDNPLYGPAGAAYVFAPQKGADEKMVEFLDGQLKAFAATIQSELGQDVAEIPGAGAAGGMGAGMVAFFSSRLQMGIETVLDTVAFDKVAADADFVFSGEGKIDFQSLRGKVVIGVARRAQKLGVPLIAIVGDIGDGVQGAYDMGVSAIFSINRVAKDFREVMGRSESDLGLTMDNLMRFVKRMDF